MDAYALIIDEQFQKESETKCKEILTLILYLIIAAEFAYKSEKGKEHVKLGKKRKDKVKNSLW